MDLIITPSNKDTMTVVKDKLEVMFNFQNKLQERLGTWDKIVDMSDRQQFINQMLLACHEEVTEIMRETAYKNPEFVKFGWKKQQAFNPEKMKEEIVDLMHFVMNLSLVAGMDANEFFDRYCKKNGINHKRQDNNY